MSDVNNTIDRPSFYWDRKYFDKANKMVIKNIEFNSNPNKKIYNKFLGLYEVRWQSFIPLFGYFYSLVEVFCCYGRIKSSSIFNEQLYKNFRNKIIWIWFIYFIFGPLLALVITFFAPVFGAMTLNELIMHWKNLFVLSDGVKLFGDNVVVKFFNSNAWWYTILIHVGISTINLSAIFASFILNDVNDNVLKIYFAEDNFKMKISRFVRKKGV